MKHALTVTRSVVVQIEGFGMHRDADPQALGFYQALGFALLVGGRTPQPLPTFLPLGSMGGKAFDAVQQQPPSAGN